MVQSADFPALRPAPNRWRPGARPPRGPMPILSLHSRPRGNADPHPAEPRLGISTRSPANDPFDSRKPPAIFYSPAPPSLVNTEIALARTCGRTWKRPRMRPTGKCDEPPPSTGPWSAKAHFPCSSAPRTNTSPACPTSATPSAISTRSPGRLPQFPPGNAGFKQVLERTLKIAVHETGHMFSLPHCTAYPCIQSGVNSLEEAGESPLWLCPECLPKIAWATSTDPRERLSATHDFCRRHDLDAAKFLQQAIDKIA